MSAAERRLALLAALTALLALVPGAVDAQEARRMTLAEAVAHASRSSEEVQVAEAELLRARGQRLEARSGLLPKLSGTAGYTRTLASEFSALRDLPVDSGQNNPFDGLSNLPFGQKNRYELGLQGSQTLFAGGRVVAANRIAQSGVRSAEIGLDGERAQLELDVTRAYYDAALSNQLVRIAEAALAQADATLTQVRAARGVGETAEFEVLRAQVARDNQKPQLIQRKADRDLAHMRLKQLLNLPLDDSLELTTPLPTRVDLIAEAGASDVDGDDDVARSTLSDTAASGRGTVRQAEELVRVREQQARIASAQRLPSLALTTQWGRVGYPPEAGVPEWSDMRSNWTVGVQLQLPLITGGAQRGAELKAEADVTEARARLQQTREAAALDARHALDRQDAAVAMWQASVGTVEQAARAYRIAEIRYREGLSTQVELSDARLMLQQAEVNRAVAARDVEVARAVVRLLPRLPLGR